jgi:hypothetical protein
MISLSMRDRLSLFEIIKSLNLSFSNQKKIISICRELASRTNQSITDLLGDPEIENILGHKRSNPPQKTANLMNLLTNRKMPRYCDAEKKFKHLVSSLKLPKNVSVTHTPYFENNRVTLSITVSTLEQFHETWIKIKDTLPHEKN